MLKKLNWGWRIGIVYTIFALSTIAWVVFAMSKEVDLVRDDYYQYSLAQDSTNLIRANARELGSGAAIVLDKNAKQMTVQIPREQAAGAQGSVMFYRPSALHKDKTYTLHLSAEGTMSIPVSQLDKGVWDVTVHWTSAAGQTYELVRRETL